MSERERCEESIRFAGAGERCPHPAKYERIAVSEDSAALAGVAVGERLGVYCGVHARFYRRQNVWRRIHKYELDARVRLIERDLDSLYRDARKTWDGLLDFAREAYGYPSDEAVVAALGFASFDVMRITLGNTPQRSEPLGPRLALAGIEQIERERVE